MPQSRAWENIILNIPDELYPRLLVDSRNCLVYAPNIEVRPFPRQKRRRPNQDPERALTEEQLHQAVIDNLKWAADLFRDSCIKEERIYGAPVLRPMSKLGHMLGLKSNYLMHGGVEEIEESNYHREDVDPKLERILEEELTRHERDPDEEESSPSPKKTRVNIYKDIARRIRLNKDYKGLEVSDEEGSQDEDSDSGCENESANHKEKLEKKVQDKHSYNHDAKSGEIYYYETSSSDEYEEADGIENSLLHDYYINKKVVGINVTDISRDMRRKRMPPKDPNELAHFEDTKILDKAILNMLKKNDATNYCKLLANMKCSPVKLTAEVLHDISIWKCWLINGQHLCFYGAGSKRMMMYAFKDVALRDGSVITIDMYRARINNCDKVWEILRREYKSAIPRENHKESKTEILQNIARSRRLIYIIVFGLEHMIMRGAFKSLVSILKPHNVRLIGVMDHLRWSMLLPVLDESLNNYRIIRLDTDQDYRKEVLSTWQVNPPSYVINRDKQKSSSEIFSIMSALSGNHRRLFALIAKIQLEKIKEGKGKRGMEKYSILRDRRALTLCNNDSKLDALLTEFITHNLIEQYRGPGGKLHLYLPFAPTELKQFIMLK